MNRRDFILATLTGLALPGMALAGAAPADAARPGDVVFRLGAPDWITHAITTHSPLPEGERRWTHAGVVVSGGDDPLIVHAMPDAGVHLVKLSDFRAPIAARDFALLQIRDPALGQRFGRAATRRLGLPFDHRLRLSSNSSMYCTELVVKALADVGVALQVPAIRVAFYSERIVHPDSLFQSLIRADEFKPADLNSIPGR